MGEMGVPSEWVGSGPVSTGAPVGRVNRVTARSRPSAASSAASPARGPNPARQSSRSACSTPKLPLYFAIGESTCQDGGGAGGTGTGGGEPPEDGPAGACCGALRGPEGAGG